MYTVANDSMQWCTASGQCGGGAPNDPYTVDPPLHGPREAGTPKVSSVGRGALAGHARLGQGLLHVEGAPGLALLFPLVRAQQAPCRCEEFLE
jgi:hypothetical protein